MSSITKISICAAIFAGFWLSHPLGATVPRPLSHAEATTYSSAVASAAKGNWTRAHRAASTLKDGLPAKILIWMDMSRHGTQQSFAAIADFIAKNPGWPSIRTLRRRAEETVEGAIPNKAVLAWFDIYPPITTAGRIRLIAALMADGQKNKAQKLIRETWVKRNFGRKQERRFRRQYRKFLSRKDHVVRLDRLLWNGRFVEARRTVPLVDKPLQKLAMARIALNEFRGGVDWHIRQVPESMRNDPGLLYERARWRRRKGLDDAAYELLKDMPAGTPFAQKWWIERSIIARRLLSKGHISEAYRLVAANGLSNGARYVEAEWLAGWIALRHLDDPKTAQEHFARIARRVNYPISKARAAYWAGRAAEVAGNRKVAATSFAEASRYDTTYYGQLAAVRTGGTARLISASIEPTESDISTFNRDERVHAVKMLNQIGARDYIQPFMRALLGETTNPVRQFLTANLATVIGRRDIAVRAGRTAYRAGAPLPEIAYPVISMPGDHPEQALLHAIVRQESNFDATAISPAGARGLMQLMPRTAQSVASRLRVGFSRDRLTRDSNYNIKLGRAYLGQMLTRFDGSYILAIASYNAGPSAAARWVRQFGDPRDPGIDVVDWIESIPYRETRNYVQRVMENLQVYRARMGGPMLAEGIVRDLQR